MRDWLIDERAHLNTALRVGIEIRMRLKLRLSSRCADSSLYSNIRQFKAVRGKDPIYGAGYFVVFEMDANFHKALEENRRPRSV